MFKLHDRVKEISYTQGSGDLVLREAVAGFRTFSSVYANQDTFFYCITSQFNYEVGLGKYVSSTNAIHRIELFDSTTGSFISWGQGLKEVYVTYAADKSVYLDPDADVPDSGYLSVWSGSNKLQASNVVIENGIMSAPSGEFDVLLGNTIKMDHVGAEILWSGQAQTKAAVPIYLDTVTQIDDILNASGYTNHSLGLKKQQAGSFFAGPTNECEGGCPDGYPAFRPLNSDDLPTISAMNVDYNPSTTGNWTTIPTNAQQALDILANKDNLYLVKTNNLSDLTNKPLARIYLGVDPSGTDNSTNVSLVGTPNYVTISGQTLTRHSIDLTSPTHISGNLPLSHLASGTNANNYTFFNGGDAWTYVPKVLKRAVIENSGELNDAKVTGVDSSGIFYDWNRFSHLVTPNTQPANIVETSGWQYIGGVVASTINSSSYIGLTSLKKYDTFDLDFIAKSTAGDNDMIGAVVAYTIDESGRQHTISVVQNLEPLNAWNGLGQLYWALVYDFRSSGGKVLDSYPVPNSGYWKNWNAYPSGLRVHITRDGDEITAYSSNFRTDHSIDSGTLLSCNLSADADLFKFRGKQAYGFSCCSQPAATFNSIKFVDGERSVIYDLENDNVQTYNSNTSTWAVTSGAYSEIGQEMILYNEDTNKLFYQKNAKEIYRINNVPEIQNSIEIVNTPNGSSPSTTFTLKNSNYQTLACTSATGTIATTLTVPTSSSAGTIIIKQNATTAVGITLAVSAGSIVWLGAQPNWSTDAASKIRMLSWRYDGTTMYLSASDTN